MGRRAVTHNSPAESAMEKYHSDIGSRLSGVFAPQTLGNICEDFCQLTLDTRHRNSLNVKDARAAAENTPRMSKPARKSSSLARKSSSSGVSTSSSTVSEEHESGAKDRTRLVDKLTRALFQKKHMCARCQRRSRSCLPNKNFTHREKHYTCAACRQQSNAVKHLFGQSANKLSASLSTNKQSPASRGSTAPVSQNKERPQHRTQNTDSGYDTVTSCSTVSSACSAFTNTTSSSYGHSQQSDSKTQISTTNTPDAADTIDMSNTTSTHPFYLKGVVQSCPIFSAPKPMEHRQVKAYDGYLPDVDYERLEKCQAVHVETVRIRTPLQDASNFEGRTVHNGSGSSLVRETVVKACYACSAINKICFKLPWEGGWLCEDCLDRVH